MLDFFKNLLGEDTKKKNFSNGESSRFVTLIVMDGLGVHPDAEGNAVLAAKTPFLDTAWTYGRSTLIQASGTFVGLPGDYAGNSEVGHLNLGAGQVVYQSLPKINEAIKADQLSSNTVIKELIDHVNKNNSNVHLMGVLSSAGVHGHISHLFSLMELCKKNGIDPYIHVMLDGRDTPPRDGFLYLSQLNSKIRELGIGHIASIMGRFYGMDRDNRWERTKLAYDALVGVSAESFTDPIQAIQKAYTRGEYDQFFVPKYCTDEFRRPIGPIKSGDAVLFWNFREDRARQITQVFVEKEFNHFVRRNYPENVYFATMTGYEENLNSHSIFPPLKVQKPISEFLADNGKTQLHLSETEKHTHVTYFFNGGIEEPHKGETFFNIPSPKVDDYAKTPAMSAESIRDETVNQIKRFTQSKYDSFILLNFANPDMLGHTGNFHATTKAVEITDQCVADVAKETLFAGGAVIITADHGNCETMINRETKEIDMAHTNNPVPLIILTNPSDIQTRADVDLIKVGTGLNARPTGLLADVSPTVLGLLGMEAPSSMTGMDIRGTM